MDSSKDKRERWWGVLETLRVHTLVCMSNISGHVKLINVAHQVSFTPGTPAFQLMSVTREHGQSILLIFKFPNVKIAQI